jgi:hypothetical protein
MDSIMSDSFIYVRNTVSGVTEALDPDEAAHRLTHDWFKKFNVVVDGPKDEVLSQPYWVDEDGERHDFEDAAPIQPSQDVIEQPVDTEIEQSETDSDSESKEIH